MRFSLILPVYGVEAYIKNCLLSILHQKNITADNFEIIIVNDSTPDKSIEVIQLVIEEYPDYNFKIVKRPNGGLSAARNTGLEIAKGEYVWFIDSDDYIEPNSLSVLNGIVEKNPDVEVVSFGHRNIYNTRTVDCPTPASLYGKITSGIDFINATSFYSAWGRIYKRNLLKERNLVFKEGILWEDGEFNLRLMPLVINHMVLPEILYNYVRRPNSISTSKKVEKTIASDLIKYDSVYHWFSNTYLDNNARKVLNHRNNEAIVFALAGIPELDSDKQMEYYAKIKKHRSRIKETFKSSSSKKDRVLGLMIMICPKILAKLLYNRMQKLLNKENDLFEV